MIYGLGHEPKTFGDWAYIGIAKHYNKFLTHEAAVLEDKDPEELHQMRVGMRRLRSAIQGFRLALNLPKNAHETKVGKIAKKLGELRDIDVLEDTLKNKYYPNLPKNEKKYLEQGISSLAKQRKKALITVIKTLNSKVYLSLKQAFAEWLNKPKYYDIAEVSIQTVLADLLLPQVSQLMLHPGWVIGVKFKEGNISFPNGLAQKEVEILLKKQGLILHDLRKEAKRTRYNMELFTQFYGDMYKTYLKDIKAIQTVLGEIQDSFVLKEFLDGVFDDNILKNMSVFSNQLQENRYHKWQQWEILQRKFLNSHTRKDFHLTVLQPSVLQSDIEDSKNNSQTELQVIYPIDILSNS